MVEISMIKHLLSDSESLSCYLDGQVVSITDVKRRLFLMQREENKQLPDQFYRLVAERDFYELNSLGTLLRKGLNRIGNSHLTLHKNIICVTGERQNEWQQMLPYLPPLVIKMAFLFHKLPFPSKNDIPSLRAYFDFAILPNARFTAMPSSSISDLQDIVKNAKGFHDLHMHLNGSTETDMAWQDFLTHPAKIYKEVKLGFKNAMVKEQLEQEMHLMDPLKFYNLIRIARRIRYILFDQIFPPATSYNYPSLKTLLKQLSFNERYSSSGTQTHPFISLLHPGEELPNLIAVEGLMYLLIFQDLYNNDRDVVATLFHYYLLIQGLINRLLVQQVHQYGFEQFQKHTLNTLREFSEKGYDKRFFQMHGNGLEYINFLEGRFSPKQTKVETTALIKAVDDGWGKFEAHLKKSSKHVPTLKLIAHFIKRKDKNPDPFIRHKELRLDTWKRGRVLSLLLKNSPLHRKKIVGIDAAASEFDAQPEVFAPTFQMMRRNHPKLSFTYHVGEDFFHIISGLRAIYEATEFLGLRTNDRIGHATAAGIDPVLWQNAVGENILIREGEWLDNLLFIYYFVTQYSVRLSCSLINLELAAQEHALRIYDNPYSIDSLVKAWLLRKFCPILTSCTSSSEARMKSVFDIEAWNELKLKMKPGIPKDIFIQYHHYKSQEKFNKIISLNLNQLFNSNDLEILQKEMLKLLFQKGIVIETLPTSNVRISHYNNFKSYHLQTWKTWKKDKLNVPPIVVGTDDTGIFATNIYNEYANIYCQLTSNGTDPKDAIDFIKSLEANSSTYKFIST